MKTVTTAQMKAIDERAIHELGIPSLELMERAASWVTAAVMEVMGNAEHPSVLVVCGTGNNGGDGLACARQLMQRGAAVQVLLAGNPQKQTRDSLTNAAALCAIGGEIQPYTGQPLPEADVIVDALFGFGLNREVAGLYHNLIAQINSAGLPVIACDIPSGLNGDTGLPMGIAVRAAVTVCFTCAKPGLPEAHAAPYVGDLRVVPIGIPEPLLE